jgi:hypothetical protein
VRAAILAISSDPLVIIAVQILDGISAGRAGVLVPLSLADISRGRAASIWRRASSEVQPA